jgi:hypothetical protein
LDETRKDESTLLFPEMLNDLATFKETENAEYEFGEEEVRTANVDSVVLINLQTRTEQTSHSG